MKKHGLYTSSFAVTEALLNPQLLKILKKLQKALDTHYWSTLAKDSSINNNRSSRNCNTQSLEHFEA